MDERGIIQICEAFQLDYGRVRGAPTPGATRNISISCPLAVSRHGDPHDANKSCSIEVADDGPSRVRCFSGNCKFHGSLLKLIRTAVSARGNPPHLVKVLNDVAKVEAVTLQGATKRGQKKVHALHQWDGPPVKDRSILPESSFASFANSVPKYAMNRGITIETAKAWGLGYDKDGHFLVFPVRRPDGALVGLVGRAISDKAKRTHHNYFGLDKAKHLFGAQMLESEKPVVVVESCIDTLNTWQALEREASVVATLGEGFTDHHALTIASKRPPFVCIFTDGDGAGRRMASMIAYTLHRHGIPTKIMECPWGKITGTTATGKFVRKKIDPSDLPYPMIREIFRDAPWVAGGKIRWTNPPPVYDPSEAA